MNFKNVIIIMANNLGSDLILSAGKEEDLRASLMELLKQSFRPEFLNRIDETVIFNRLGRDEIGKIVDIQFKRLASRLAGRKITLTLTQAAKDFLAEMGYDPLFGARPLKRTMQAELENPLARAVIAGTVKEGDTVTSDRTLDGEGLVFKQEVKKQAEGFPQNEGRP